MIFNPQCLTGWAGDGTICGPDSDIDGWPDDKLLCDGLKCRAVFISTCIEMKFNRKNLIDLTTFFSLG